MSKHEVWSSLIFTPKQLNKICDCEGQTVTAKDDHLIAQRRAHDKNMSFRRTLSGRKMRQEIHLTVNRQLCT